MEAKKQYILDNVCKLYLKYGIRTLTMDDIATEFGISKKTLYQYFNDKEDLITQAFSYYMENPVFDFGGSGTGNAIDKILEFREHVVFILKNFNNKVEFELKKFYPALHRNWHDFKIRKIYEGTFSNLEDGKRQGLFREDLDSEFTAKLQVGRMLLILNPESGIFSEEEILSPEIYDKTIDYHLHAICTSGGLEYYKLKLKQLRDNQKSGMVAG